MTSTIFKAYDIRGIVGQTLNETVVSDIGQAMGSKAIESGQLSLVVGRDGRRSSPSLSAALITGILASGCDVIDIGQVTTPMLYFACERLKTYSGIMVTGSHNPPEYNGLKFVLAGKSVVGEALTSLYNRIQKKDLSTGLGHQTTYNIEDDYIADIVNSLTVSRSFKVVIDCGNGAAGPIAPRLFSELGCDLISLYCDPDGDFPNHDPNPSQPENMQDLIAAVKKHDADLGIAFDGDGDRVGIVDGQGQIIWPDRLMMLFAKDVLSRKPNSTIIYDVKCSYLLADIIEQAGGRPVMCRSGYSVIKNTMQEMDAVLAGEMSGHIFFKENWYGFDDGLYVASRLLALLADMPAEESPTDVFSQIPNQYNTPEIIVEMSDEMRRDLIDKLQKHGQFEGAKISFIDGVRVDYPTAWGLVRSSNTMPSLTLRFEASTMDGLNKIQQQFKQQIIRLNPEINFPF